MTPSGRWTAPGWWTDRETLQVAITAANRVTHEILEGLSRQRPAGGLPERPGRPTRKAFIGGVDHQLTRPGRARSTSASCKPCWSTTSIPVASADRGATASAGNSYRLNSDAVAVEVAKALRAVKLVYLNTEPAASVGSKGVVRQLTVEEADAFLQAAPKPELTPEAASTKLAHAVRAGKERGGAGAHHRRAGA